MDDVLFESGRYQVKVVELLDDVEDGGRAKVYGIFNKATGVREGETRHWSHAVNGARKLEEAANAAMEESAGSSLID